MNKTPRFHASALVLALGALAASGGAQAQGYVGGGIGPSRIGIDCSGFDSCDKTSTGGKLYGGYLFAPQLGVELNYFDWGKATVKGMVDDVPASGDVKGEGLGIGVAYIAAITPAWNGVARVGVARNRGKSTVRSLGASASETFRSTEAYLGFGVGYNVMPNLAVTGDVDFSRLKYGSNDKANVRMFTLGVRYTF
jgi:OOP family OmpA-OmpF porin